jgi:hypothetical protein
MDRTLLVGFDVKEGERLIEALDAANFPISAALWLYVSESDQWRLVIASPTYDKLGPLAAIKQVQTVLLSLEQSELVLSNIQVIGDKGQLVKALRSEARSGVDFSGKRLSQTMLDRVFIPEAYVYRVQ